MVNDIHVELLLLLSRVTAFGMTPHRNAHPGKGQPVPVTTDAHCVCSRTGWDSDIVFFQMRFPCYTKISA